MPSVLPPPPPPPPPIPYQQIPHLPSQFPSYPPTSWIPPSSYNYTQPASPIPGGGPMSNRRQFGRAGQLRPEFEEEISQFGEDLYVDDGSQPLPAVCVEPPSQLVQDWPFGNKAGMEGECQVWSKQELGFKEMHENYFSQKKALYPTLLLAY